MKKLDCIFDEKYFNQNDAECVMKVEDGRNKFAGGHGELAKAIEEDVVSTVKMFTHHYVMFSQRKQVEVW